MTSPRSRRDSKRFLEKLPEAFLEKPVHTLEKRKEASSTYIVVKVGPSLA